MKGGVAWYVNRAVRICLRRKDRALSREDGERTGRWWGEGRGGGGDGEMVVGWVEGQEGGGKG